MNFNFEKPEFLKKKFDIKKLGSCILAYVLCLAMAIPCFPVGQVTAYAQESTFTPITYLTGNATYKIDKTDSFYYTLNETAGTVTITAYFGNEAKVIIPETVEGKKVTEIAVHAICNLPTMEELQLPSTMERVNWHNLYNCPRLRSIVVQSAIIESVAWSSLNAYQKHHNITIYASDELYADFNLNTVIASGHNFEKLSTKPTTGANKTYTWTNSKEKEITCKYEENDDFVYIHNVTENNVAIILYKKNEDKLVIPSQINGIPVTKIEKYAIVNKSVKEIVIPETIKRLGEDAIYQCKELRTIEFKGQAPKIERGLNPNGRYSPQNYLQIIVPNEYINQYKYEDYYSVKDQINAKHREIYDSYGDDYWPSGYSAYHDWYDNFTSTTESGKTYKAYRKSGWYQLIKYNIETVNQKTDNAGKQTFLSGNAAYREAINNCETTEQKRELEKTLVDNTDYMDCFEAKLTDDGCFYYMNKTQGTAVFAGYLGTDSKIVIPNKVDGYEVTKIEKRAFENCDYITEIEIPGTVEYIGNYALQNSSSILHTIRIKGAAPIIDYPGLYIGDFIKIIIPASQKNTYVLQGCDELVEIIRSKKSEFMNSGNPKWMREYRAWRSAWLDTEDGQKYWEFKNYSWGRYDSILITEDFEPDCRKHGVDTETKGVVEASCTKEGYTGDTYCKNCNKVVKQGEVIPKTSHIEVKDEAVEATCTEDGYTGDTRCKNCDEVLKQGEVIPKTGHVEVIDKAVEATCTQEGKTEGSHCSECNKVLKAQQTVDKKGHTIVLKGAAQATYEKAGYTGDKVCKVCNTKIETGKEIAKLEAKAGDTVTDDKSGANYEIKTNTSKKQEVVYDAPVATKDKNVKVPDSVKIGDKTYKVVKVDDGAFKGNATVEKVTLGKNITTIGKDAFNGAAKLKTVSVGKNVTSIGNNAFKGCKKLKTLTITSKKLTSKNISKKAFAGISSKTTIKVPKSKLKAYTKLFKSKGLSNKVTIKGI